MPMVILPLLYSYYVSLLIYLLFLSIILIEINSMKDRVIRSQIINIFFIVTIVSFFLFLLLLITEQFSIILILNIIITIWLFDTFSYLGGKIFGGKKLMPKISSGKTVSGLITGVSGTLLICVFILFFLGNTYGYSIFFITSVVILSFIGDMSVSLIKRYATVKDSGNIMPGHGGLLDRFDSFIMVFFIIGIFYLIK